VVALLLSGMRKSVQAELIVLEDRETDPQGYDFRSRAENLVK
jgi:hypothetical protein